MRASPHVEERSQTLPRWPDVFVTSETDRRALFVLTALRGISPLRLLEVASAAGSASATLAAIRAGRAGSANDQRFARSLDPDALERAASACGARLVAWGSPEYPPQLAHIPDPPAALYAIGGPLPAASAAAAVVGARRCSDLGRDMSRAIGRGLAAAGVTVVSGAARGIDAAAHEGALDARGSTVAVLGCGIDRVYPPGSRSLLERIRASGAVVSEYAPGVPAEPQRFPARNRIVAGLCAAVVVVQGTRESGSMITAEHALEFGRDVFAVPGAVNDPLAQAPLRLIREGATLVRDADDLLRDLGLASEEGVAERRVEVTALELTAYGLVAGPTLPETVARGLATGIPEALALLLSLELKGLVRSIGGRFERRPSVVPQSERAVPPPREP